MLLDAPRTDFYRDAIKENAEEWFKDKAVLGLFVYSYFINLLL